MNVILLLIVKMLDTKHRPPHARNRRRAPNSRDIRAAVAAIEQFMERLPTRTWLISFPACALGALPVNVSLLWVAGGAYTFHTAEKSEYLASNHAPGLYWLSADIMSTDGG